MMNSENVSLMTNFNIIVILINCLLGIEELIKTGITDLVVALGLNHAKMGWSETDNAVDRLVKYYRLIKRGIPALRLYYVEVPPSLSRITSLRALMMNRWMAGPCSELGVRVVNVPKAIIREDGSQCLNLEMAVEGELDRDEVHQLHYNMVAKKLVCSNKNCHKKRNLTY